MTDIRAMTLSLLISGAQASFTFTLSKVTLKLMARAGKGLGIAFIMSRTITAAQITKCQSREKVQELI